MMEQNDGSFYAGRQIADQIHDDFDYSKLEPVIQISIMDYTLFSDHKVFYNEYWPQDKTGYTYTDKLKFLVMDLSAINEASEEQKETGLVEWAKAFRAESWDEVKGIENAGVKEAAKTMELIMSNPTEREWIRMRRDAEVDRRTEQKGERLEIARGLKRDGVDPAIIAKNTGLSASEIAKL